MQTATTDLVNTGNELLALSRQLQPKLDQLRTVSATIKHLRASTDRVPALPSSAPASSQQQATVVPQQEPIELQPLSPGAASPTAD